MAKFVDITDQKYGMLTAIKRIKRPRGKKDTGAWWLVKCNCGNEKILRANTFKTGNTKSCGCLTSQLMTESRKLEDGLSQKRTVFSYYRRNAKKKDIDFNLSFNQLITLTSSNCYYCGADPSNIQKSRNNSGDYIYNGLDRLNNNKGYLLNNVVPCCKICNVAKNNRNLSEFKSWIKTVQRHLQI